ncbi:(2Fe-2S) ferredoxin domain-containing protein [Anaerorhabdus sp.]|uniref:(2Fe-2S) ferredoxin domain-containing protein n=1 Tax=Anaerorhabdus sp. TaxID=1872524 RepID=UPI002B213824|nr:(2Fe-2S) ferredoxin domain-containing protein [Anaerorhabdus sp.]MEA4874320.1 (2Fe-2S) ferredoxin domain-containing protein [Anaerorhabdus sp.]
MVKIEVCIGSACYVKGSNQVVTILQSLVKENQWEEKVEIKGSFCMQSCQGGHGLGIRINGRQLLGVGLHNVEEVLKQEISEALS